MEGHRFPMFYVVNEFVGGVPERDIKKCYETIFGEKKVTWNTSICYLDDRVPIMSPPRPIKGREVEVIRISDYIRYAYDDGRGDEVIFFGRASKSTFMTFGYHIGRPITVGFTDKIDTDWPVHRFVSLASSGRNGPRCWEDLVDFTSDMSFATNQAPERDRFSLLIVSPEGIRRSSSMNAASLAKVIDTKLNADVGGVYQLRFHIPVTLNGYENLSGNSHMAGLVEMLRARVETIHQMAPTDGIICVVEMCPVFAFVIGVLCKESGFKRMIPIERSLVNGEYEYTSHHFE